MAEKAKSSRWHFWITCSRRAFRTENIQQRPLFFWLVIPVVGTTTEKSIRSLAAAAGTKEASFKSVRLMALDITAK